MALGFGLTGASTALVVPATALSAPAVVQCGQVVTTSIVVGNDLNECIGDGLVVGAPGVTIDLGGHTFDGVGLGAGVLNAGFDDVTITNGTVGGFDFGVLLTAGAAGNVITGLTPTLNAEAAVQLSGVAPGNEVHGNRFVDNDLAVSIVEGSEGVVVRANVVGTSSGHAVHIIGSHGNRIEDNDLTGAADGGIVLHGASDNVLARNVLTGIADGAIILDLESNNNRIEANVVTDSEGGVLIDSSFGNQVIGNTMHRMSDDAVDLEEAHRSVVLGNDLRFNAGGVELIDSTENRVEANLTGESAGTGIAVEGVAQRNVIVKNDSNDNESFGITVIGVTLPEDGNLLYKNQTNGNAGGGINVSVGGHTVTANEARGNSGWGIYAGTGSIDGGFNAASGNSELSQCFGVVCLPVASPPPDIEPPDTTITDAPRPVTVLASATFEFAAGPGEFGARFECSLNDAAFVACAAPQRFTGLAHGSHTFAVRAIDLDGNVDPTPARHQWAFESIPTVDCGRVVTVLADADAWIDQNSSTANKGTDSALKVRSKGPSDNFRTFVRFPLPVLTKGCEVDAATLRLHADGPALGRTLEAWRLAGRWAEETVSWQSQPDAAGSAARVPSGEGFRSWDVEDHVQAMYDDHSPHGFMIKDAVEGADAEQIFSPREDEFGPQLVIRFTPIFEAPPEDTTRPDTAIDSGPDPFVFSSTEAGSTFECALDEMVPAGCTSPFATGALPVGTHTFTVAAIDPAGNRDESPAQLSWTVEPPPDTTPPEASIDDGPVGDTTETSATFTFSANEAASFECALDDDEPTPCASPVTYSDLGLGTHNFSVRATDLALNEGAAVSRSWTIVPPPDTSPPDTRIDSGPPASTSARSASFTFSATEEGSTFECGLDGATLTDCKSPADYVDLAIGGHTFEVRATDSAGNRDPQPASHHWTVEPPPDTSPPDTTIDLGPPLTTMDTSATFVFSSADVTATFECALDGAAFTGCASPVELAGVAAGPHTFVVRASDPAGNIEDPPASYGWTVVLPPPPPGDNTAPLTTIAAGPEQPTTSDTSATFIFAADDPTATFECLLDVGDFAPCSSPVNYTGLTLGSHTFSVRASDPVPNTEDPPVTYQWTVVEPPDTTAPTVTILGGPPATTSETAASFTFSVDEPATIECALDGPAVAACGSPAGYSGLALGTHTFVVRATDAAGNESSATYRWTVVAPPDTTAPVVAITGGPPTPTSATSATFSFTVDEPATIRCSFDSGAFTICASPRTYTALALGPHTFEVQATDSAGNVGAASSMWTIVDITPPNTTITSGPANPTTATSASFAFTANEAGVRFECRLDSTEVSAFTPCTSPRTHSGLAVGSHTFDVRAIDPSNNHDPTPASYRWTIQPPPDTTAPETSITSAPPASTLSTAALFEFVANEQASMFECRLDAGAWLTCTSPRSYVNVPVGPHAFEVRATDRAGNVGVPDRHEWTVVLPPPPPPPGPTCAIATLIATADAWIDENSPMTNKGDDSILKVRSKGPHDNFRAFVRFDQLPPAPAGCIVGSATLRLHAGSSGEGRTLQVQRTLAGWSENGVTWSNQPPAEGPISTTSLASDVDDLEWAVGVQVQSAYDSGTVSFVVRDSVEGEDAEQQFHSREKGEAPPQLVIQFVQVTS